MLCVDTAPLHNKTVTEITMIDNRSQSLIAMAAREVQRLSHAAIRVSVRQTLATVMLTEALEELLHAA